MNAQSQFVVYHKGVYCKFEQTYVIASENPLDFEGKPIVSSGCPTRSCFGSSSRLFRAIDCPSAKVLSVC